MSSDAKVVEMIGLMGEISVMKGSTHFAFQFAEKIRHRANGRCEGVNFVPLLIHAARGSHRSPTRNLFSNGSFSISTKLGHCVKTSE